MFLVYELSVYLNEGASNLNPKNIIFFFIYFDNHLPLYLNTLNINFDSVTS